MPIEGEGNAWNIFCVVSLSSGYKKTLILLTQLKQNCSLLCHAKMIKHFIHALHHTSISELSAVLHRPTSYRLLLYHFHSYSFPFHKTKHQILGSLIKMAIYKFLLKLEVNMYCTVQWLKKNSTIIVQMSSLKALLSLCCSCYHQSQGCFFFYPDGTNRIALRT